METLPGMDRSIPHVGLDVHQESIDVAVADGSVGVERSWAEVRHVGQIGGDLLALDKTLRRLMSQGPRLHVVYEAGPCGFVISRHLPAQGLDCEVAPSARTRCVSSATHATLKTLLLRHGVRYAGKTAWTPAHLRWLATVKLAQPTQQVAFQKYVHAISASRD